MLQTSFHGLYKRSISLAFGVYFLPARRHDSAVLAVVPCLSVCWSQVGVLSKRLDGSGWLLVQKLPSTYPMHSVVEKLGYLR